MKTRRQLLRLLLLLSAPLWAAEPAAPAPKKTETTKAAPAPLPPPPLPLALYLTWQRDPAGTRYLGDGAWAVNTRVTTPFDQASYLERAHSKNHVFVVTLHPGRADFVAVDPTGAEFDKFTIEAGKR